MLLLGRKAGYRTSICLVLVIGVMGCATIMRGRTQSVRFNSSPAGARVFINGEDRGSTPATLELKRNKDYRVVVKKEGYKDVTVNIDKEFTIGWPIIGNVFSWGLLGVIVDVADGAAYKLTPEETMAALEVEKVSFAPTNNHDTFQLAVFSRGDLEVGRK